MIDIKQYKIYLVYKKKAFTLVEVMIGIMLTTIVLTSAYMIWSRVQLRISRSYTKQTLQNELRKVANYMQNDFKSIKFYEKDDKESNKAVDIKGDDKNLTMTFQKFKELKDEDNKLAQDEIEEVKYLLKDKVLKRACGNKEMFLTSHCEGIIITTAAGDNSKSDSYKYAKESVKTAKEAQLDIEITGKKNVPGSGEEIYHIEKTSVVMRNEYYKKINKNYKSNFDLAKQDANKIVGEKAYGALSSEKLDYSKLDKDVLQNLKTSEQEVLKSLEDSLKDINQSISDTAPEDVPWYNKLWANIKDVFGNDEDAYTQFKKSRSDLENAKDSKACEAAIKDLKAKIERQEKNFYSQVYTKKSYSSMTKEEQTTFKRAYDMAMQEKSINDAYNKLDPKDRGPKPTTNIQLQKDIVNSETATPEQKEQAQKILDVYKDIHLDKMQGSESELGIYNANKQLMEQANTKIEILRSKEKTEDNIKDINTELNKKK